VELFAGSAVVRTGNTTVRAGLAWALASTGLVGGSLDMDLLASAHVRVSLSVDEHLL
jgi:hypothetical protein